MEQTSNGNLLAEQSVIGSILLDSEGAYWPPITQTLTAGDFADPQCRALYQAALKSLEGGTASDYVGIIAAAGVSADYATQLLEVTPTAVNVGEYAAIVHSQAVLRRLRDLAQQLAGRTLAPDADPQALAASTAAQLDNLLTERAAESCTASTILQQWINGWPEESELVATVPTLDRLIGGLGSGRFYVVGARPGVGKSAFLVALAQMAARQHRVLYVSLEMDGKDLMQRIVSSYSGVPYKTLGNPKEFRDDVGRASRITEASNKAAQLQLEIQYRPSCTVSDIAAMARVSGADVVFVDYIGLMSGPGKTEYERLSAISTGLKQLSMSLSVPIIAAAQLNRATGDKKDGGPKLTNLKGSGSLEQDADVVILLDRDMDDQQQTTNLCVSVSKNRRGQCGTFQLQFTPGLNRLKDTNFGADFCSWT